MEHNIILKAHFFQIKCNFFLLTVALFLICLILKYLMAYNVFCYKKGGYLETFANVKKPKEELKKHGIFVDGKHYLSLLRVAYTFSLKKQFFFIHLYMDSKCPRVRRLFDNAMMF